MNLILNEVTLYKFLPLYYEFDFEGRKVLFYPIQLFSLSLIMECNCLAVFFKSAFSCFSTVCHIVAGFHRLVEMAFLLLNFYLFSDIVLFNQVIIVLPPRQVMRHGLNQENHCCI